MKKLLLLAALISAAALAQTTVTIPAQTIMVKIPEQTITIPASSPVVTPDPSGVAWGYHNGQLLWAGDFTQKGTAVDYSTGTFTSTAAWGLWLPYFAANYSLPNPGYTSLLVSLKPTIANQHWSIYFVRAGDIPTGIVLDISKYGPAPVQGQWGQYVVPLADLGVANDATLYKLGLKDQTGVVPNKWQFKDVGFL